MKKLIEIIFISILLLITSIGIAQIPESSRSKRAIQDNIKDLKNEFDNQGLEWGSEIFVRIFKTSENLEVWVKEGNRFKLFKKYSICYFSGDLGPKTRQGDGQSPEGFYFVRPQQMNPWSSYHLSFNLGYPNKYDRAHGYTGNYLMVHGNCVSIGCYAMTDKVIEEIWTLMYASLSNSQKFIRVHIFPFKMTDSELEKRKSSKWYSYWKNLKTGYDWFETKKVPPNVEVRNRKYVFD